MKNQVLAWDSGFFGLRVAQIEVDRVTDPARLAGCLEETGADVTYVFLSSPVAQAYHSVLEESGGLCFDHRVTYAKPVVPASAAEDAAAVTLHIETGDLLRLAYASGHLSRFYLDPWFRPHFQRLYREWVRKALQEAGAKVFAFMAADVMTGMVTTSVSEGVGKIGLIAVDERYRGQGVGRRLLNQCEAFYLLNNVGVCKVVTQKNNLSACRLYEKQGYQVEEDVEVWHVWKKGKPT